MVVFGKFGSDQKLTGLPRAVGQLVGKDLRPFLGILLFIWASLSSEEDFH